MNFLLHLSFISLQSSFSSIMCVLVCVCVNYSSFLQLIVLISFSSFRLKVKNRIYALIFSVNIYFHLILQLQISFFCIHFYLNLPFTRRSLKSYGKLAEIVCVFLAGFSQLASAVDPSRRSPVFQFQYSSRKVLIIS